MNSFAFVFLLGIVNILLAIIHFKSGNHGFMVFNGAIGLLCIFSGILQ